MQSPNQNHLILEMDEQDKIKLGKRRSGVHKQDRLDRQHEDAMAGKEVQTNKYGTGINIDSHHKASADPFPHTCRYYRGCSTDPLTAREMSLDNAVQNKAHFDDVHPLTIDEEHFYLTIYRQNPNGKTVHELSILYGRSEDTIKQILSKNSINDIPRWGRRSKEIEDLHQRIKMNRAAIVYDWNVMVQSATLEPIEPTFSIPTSVESIQGQNYLTGDQPDILSQMQNGLTAGSQLLEQYTALKEWKVEAEEREKGYQERIQTLQEYAQNLDKLVTYFTGNYEKLIQSESDLDEDTPPTL